MEPHPPRARLAPTPTGMLHLGNARTFLVAWLAARAEGGAVVLRIEDIDRERVRPEFEQAQIDDLHWLGLDWDEGPDLGGSHAPYRQSERLGLYRDALSELRSKGCVFPCTCSRKEIQLVASAPHQGDEQSYPGTCRSRFTDGEDAHRQTGREPAWRFAVEPGTQDFEDLILGSQRTDTHALVGDFVVCRRDGWPAYQLAVTVDDAAMGITQVVRADDLVNSTARQLLLYGALGLAAPSQWAHLPLVLDAGGERLAKRSKGTSLCELRGKGVSAERVIGLLARSLGLVADASPVSAAELISEFSWSRLNRRPVTLGPEDFQPHLGE